MNYSANKPCCTSNLMSQVVLGDLADQEVSAIFRAVRSDFAPVNALSRDIALAAGEELGDRLERIGSIPLGGAVMTPAGNLPADFIIHVVVMSEDEPQNAASVHKALQNGLRRASDWALESLALPPLGIGVGTIEADDSARALLEILFNHLDEGQPPLALTVVVGSEYESGLFSQLVDELSGNRTRN